MKFNGKSDNRNNRTTNFKLDTAKADLDKDGKLSSYERARGMAIQKKNLEEKPEIEQLNLKLMLK